MQEYSNIQEKRNINPVKSNVIKQTQKAPAKKQRRKISGSAILCIILLLVITGSAGAVYFDIAGAKQMVVSILKINASAPTAESTAQTDMEAQTAALEQKAKDLSVREQNLKTKEDELGTKEQGIAGREKAVTDVEAQLNSDKQQQSYIQTSAKIFEQMDAAKAAKAIGGMKTTGEMAQILLHMSTEKAALVMNQMSSSLATKILSAMMK
jgi:flagellar motility protein MotE (MotC chaperone)